MIGNILALAAVAAIGGVVFVAVGIAFIKCIDILENNYD